jgi:hypothetical protein
MAYQAPPIYSPVVEKDGKATLPYILFFNQLFTGDVGTDWTPTFTNLTQVGAPVITGHYYKLSDSLVYFRVKIIPSTSTTSSAGSTYINNFPLTISGDGACFALSGLLGTSAGMCDQASGKIYVPAWSAVTIPLSIVGLVEAS